MKTGDIGSVGARLVAAISEAARGELPFTHWTLSGMFAPDVVDRLLALPLAVPVIGHDRGTREANDSARVFFDPARRRAHAVCDEIAQGFQHPAVIAAFEQCFGIPLGGSFLRLEYAQDTTGFWLERHTDIRVKLVSLLVYLSKEPEAADYGTDLYDEAGRHVKRVPFVSNHALAFVPGDDTWHGFERRPMPVVRRTLIVNYVTAAWRDRFELAAPDEPVRGAWPSGTGRAA